MKKLKPQHLAAIRMILIPLLAAVGGYGVGNYPAEVTAFCSGIN